jgi:hypothetical protein
MNIEELRRHRPSLFHPTQDWFEGESFMWTALPADAPTELPTGVEYAGMSPELIATGLEVETWPAVVLVNLYCKNPLAPIWSRYLWTSDHDHLGQRVFIGANERGLEIHRHLHLTTRWGIPTWEDE